MFLREDDVTRHLAEFLRKEHFDICSQAPGNKPGDDLVARSPEGSTLRIEAKGQGFTKAWKRGEIYQKVAPAVFNQLRSLCGSKKNGGKDVFGLAFPESTFYREYLDEALTEFLLGLGLLIFFVHEDGRVEVCGKLPA